MSDRIYPERKVKAVAELEEIIKGSNSIFLADFTGLSVEKITQLRDKFYEKEIPFLVVKNTLTKIALHNSGITGLDDFLNGPTGLAFGGKDPAIPAKIMIEFAKAEKKPQIKSCLFEGVPYGPDKIDLIKDLPTRDEVIALLVSQIAAPLSNFVGVLNEIVRSFVGVIDAIIKQKEANA